MLPPLDAIGLARSKYFQPTSGTRPTPSSISDHPEPLSHSEKRWVPVTLLKGRAANDTDSRDIVDRKVKGLLNKLTMSKLDLILDQIIAWANKPQSEKDGRTFIQVIHLVF